MSISRSQTIIKNIARLNSRIGMTEVAEEHGAVLTLRRTNVLAITTAGTTITWESALRNFQFTWAGTDITIPATGWYALQASLRFSVNLNNCLVVINRNGVNVTSYNLFGDVDRNINSVTMLQYFAANDILQIIVFPSANCNINVISEGSVGESPILHIVQLSGAVNV